MNVLPFPLILSVVTYLRALDLLNTKKVSKLFYKIVHDKEIVEQFCVRRMPDKVICYNVWKLWNHPDKKFLVGNTGRLSFGATKYFHDPKIEKRAILFTFQEIARINQLSKVRRGSNKSEIACRLYVRYDYWFSLQQVIIADELAKKYIENNSEMDADIRQAVEIVKKQNEEYESKKIKYAAYRLST